MWLQGGKLTTPEQRQKELHDPEHLVVLGCGAPIKRLADSLAEFCPPGSKITLAVSDHPRYAALCAQANVRTCAFVCVGVCTVVVCIPEHPRDASVCGLHSMDDKPAVHGPPAPRFNADYQELRAAYGNLKVNGVSFRVLRGNTSSNAFLLKLGVTDADSVILGAASSSDSAIPADADALVRAHCSWISMQGRCTCCRWWHALSNIFCMGAAIHQVWHREHAPFVWSCMKGRRPLSGPA